MSDVQFRLADFFASRDGRPFDLLAYGNPNIDYVFSADHVPKADEKVLGKRIGSFAGGTVANVACASARLGASVASYGRIGDDIEGQFLLQENDRFGVSNTYIRTSHQPTSAVSLVVDKSGEKALIYAPMDDEPIDETLLTKAISQSKILYAMPYNLEEFRVIAGLAHSNNLMVAIDVEPAVAPTQERLFDLLEHTDILFMNESGFRKTSRGEPGFDTLQPLLDKGPMLVVVTLGDKGAVACTKTHCWSQPAFPVKMIDSTGAGDCFNGAFLTALIKGQSINDALLFATAAGSISVTGLGARTAIPNVAEVHAMISGKG
jgi:sugar/nucleoside kinase (ribokinase family)